MVGIVAMDKAEMDYRISNLRYKRSYEGESLAPLLMLFPYQASCTWSRTGACFSHVRGQSKWDRKVWLERSIAQFDWVIMPVYSVRLCYAIFDKFEKHPCRIRDLP